jgi:HlyD family type I secretion membrane fusion protein
MLTDSSPELLRPISSDEFLPPIDRWSSLGGIILSGTVGVAFLLASLIRYNVTVKAASTVRPAGELRVVQAAMAGTIAKVNVKENQVVKQGDAIATLEDSELLNKKSQLQSTVQQNQLQLAQMTAQINSLASQYKAESALMDRTVASAQADLTLNRRGYQDKQVVAKAEVKEAEAALALARTEMEQYQQLSDTGAIAQLQITQKQQAFRAAQARLEGAKAALNPSGATVDIAEERIAQELARGRSTLANLDKEREALLQRKIEVQNQLDLAGKELQLLETEFKKSQILAPNSGTILKLELRNPGQVVQSGDLVAQIAPSNTPLVVKGRVLPQDISKVSVCQEKVVENCRAGKVQLRFSAYPHSDYGTLKGAVRAIAPDAITPPTNGVTPASPYYEVTIQPAQSHLMKDNTRYPLEPGMEATADIIAQEETVLSFFLRKAKLLVWKA